MKTGVVVAFAGVVLLGTACSGRSDAVDQASPAPPTGTGLVLRTRTTGGIAGLGGPGSLPDFSLYGDGRAIAGGRALTEYHLTPQALRRLVAEASEAGLATPRTIDDPNMADAFYKVVTFVTGGRARTSKIIQGGGGGRVARFLERLNPSTWPRADLTADPRPYRPERVAVLAAPGEGTGPTWPLRSLASATKVGVRGCTVLTGDDAAKAQRISTRSALWTDHGKVYRVTVRPLLPDETGCAALT